MAKICLINDTHWGVRGDSEIFLEYFHKFYDNIFLPYLKQNNIKHIIHLGDLCDKRKNINFRTLESMQSFLDKVEANDIKLDFIIGNHDITYRNTNELNCGATLLRNYSNINVYSKPTEVNLYGETCLYVPWINSENMAETNSLVKSTQASTVFGHFEFTGFCFQADGVVNDDHGISRADYNKFDKVISGHYHTKADDGKIFYLGSQYEMTFIDYGDKKGFHIYDTETKDLTFVENPYTMFYKLYYDDEKQDYATFNVDEYKNKYIKVIVTNKTDPYIYDNLISRIYAVQPAHISIIDEQGLEDNLDDVNVDLTEDTTTIMNRYIDDTVTENIPEVKRIMNTLYMEANELG